MLFIIVLIGFGLRLVNLAQQPYFGDEILSLNITTHFPAFPDLFHYLGDVEFHPPLYYVFLHYWVNLFGQTPFATRMLSVIFGLGTIVLTYYLAQALFQNFKVSLLASFFIAFFPLQLELSQYARPYTVLAFAGILSALAIWKYFETNDTWHLVWFILASLFGLYIHYSFLLILFATSTWAFYQSFIKKDSKAFTLWLVSMGSIVLGFSFWLKNLLYKLVLGNFEIYGANRTLITTRISDFFEYIFNKTIWFTKEGKITQIEILTIFIAKILILICFVWVISKLAKIRFAERKQIIFLAWLTVVPAALFLFTQYSVPYTDTYVQHLIFITVPIAIVLAWAISFLEARKYWAMLLIFIFSFIPSISSVLANGALNDPDYQLQSEGQFISQNYQPGDLVVVLFSYTRVDLNYYLSPNISAVSLLPIDYYGGDFWNSRETLGFAENEYQTRIVPVTEAQIREKLNIMDELYKPRRVWLVGVSANNYPVHHWFMDRNWRHVYQSISDVYLVDLYSK